MAGKAFIKKHAVAAYFALTFAISWGAILLVMGVTGGIPGTKEQLQRLMPVAIPALLGGPSIAGLLFIGLTSGRAGYRELLSRLLQRRVGARWYAVSLLTAPVLMTATLLGLSLASPVFLPGILTSDDKGSRLLLGMVAALAAGIFEELGWTGFAIPRLRQRHSLFATGLIVGVLWGAWHILVNVILASGAYSGTLSLHSFLIARSVGDVAGQLPAFRVLMVWLYDRTGSLLLAMLMHLSLTASTIILEPLGIAGTALVTLDLVTDGVWWGAVAAVAVANRESAFHVHKEILVGE